VLSALCLAAALADAYTGMKATAENTEYVDKELLDLKGNVDKAIDATQISTPNNQQTDLAKPGMLLHMARAKVNISRAAVLRAQLWHTMLPLSGIRHGVVVINHLPATFSSYSCTPCTCLWSCAWSYACEHQRLPPPTLQPHIPSTKPHLHSLLTTVSFQSLFRTAMLTLFD
jgi:hypothetical protein